MRAFRAAGIVFSGFAMMAAATAPCGAAILAKWVQLGPDGAASVRAVTDGECPAVVFDHVRAAMKKRASPNTPFQNVKPAAFPVTGCEAVVPAHARRARLDGQIMPLPREPRRILVFGDTGCRVDALHAQACNDPESWPFPKIAAAAARMRPDLVIHLGDYLYREKPCPPGNTGCAGTPSGYGWDAWAADFFTPAKPLLAAAPWVFVRGNHEDCDRAGEGWFRFLDREPLRATCEDLSGIFVARTGKFGIVVVDGAKADDAGKDPDHMRAVLKRQFQDIAAAIPGEAWLAVHRPFDAMRAADNGAPLDVVDNSIQEDAMGESLPAGVRMIVSGHIHFFQALDFGGRHAPQLVAGTGGDILAPMPPVSVGGARINGLTVAKSASYSGFAYMIWERKGADWLGTLFDVDGKALDHCRLSNRTLGCAQS